MRSKSEGPQAQYLVLERVDGARNMYRYYVLSIEPSLFGDTSFVRRWGRLGRAGGRRVSLHADRDAAREELSAWLERKVRRGYSIRRGGGAW